MGLPRQVLHDPGRLQLLPCAHASISQMDKCRSGGRCAAQGKVVFVAPTRPLVAQQIDACYRFMGVPKVPPRTLCVGRRSRAVAGVAQHYVSIAAASRRGRREGDRQAAGHRGHAAALGCTQGRPAARLRPGTPRCCL